MHMFACVYMCVCVCVCVCARMMACVCVVCVYVLTYEPNTASNGIRTRLDIYVLKGMHEVYTLMCTYV